MRRYLKNHSREAVVKSLRELELLFGKKPADTKQNARLQSGAGDTEKLKVEVHNEC